MSPSRAKGELPTRALAAWKQRYDRALEQIRNAHDAIEALSEIAPDEHVDMKICFAGNTLRGSESLLREADVAFKAEVR